MKKSEKQKNAEKSLEEKYLTLDGLENDFRNFNLTELILSYLKDGSVFDIGCGMGHLLAKANDAGHATYGLEPSKKMIEYHKKVYGNETNFYHLNAEDLDKVKEKFDNILMLDVLEHIEDDGLIVRKVREKLAPNGKFIIVVPAYNFLYSPRDKKIGHYRRYYPGGLKKLLQKNGYNIKELRSWNILGIIPYFIFNTLLKVELSTQMRTKKEKGVLKKAMSKFLMFWMGKVENRYNFGIGLSVICIATKK